MARIVIASASEASREKLSRLLAAAGFAVFRVCASGSELRRALNTCEDGIVLMVGCVPGCAPDDVIADFGDSFHFLLVGRPEQLEDSESPRLFRLQYPCHGSAVLGAVEMLTQLHAMGLPRRSGEERALVDRAKALLMEEYHISEPEAHRRMQQYAMRHGIRMVDYAEQLIAGEEQKR